MLPFGSKGIQQRQLLLAVFNQVTAHGRQRPGQQGALWPRVRSGMPGFVDALLDGASISVSRPAFTSVTVVLLASLRNVQH